MFYGSSFAQNHVVTCCWKSIAISIHNKRTFGWALVARSSSGRWQRPAHHEYPAIGRRTESWSKGTCLVSDRIKCMYYIEYYNIITYIIIYIYITSISVYNIYIYNYINNILYIYITKSNQSRSSHIQSQSFQHHPVPNKHSICHGRVRPCPPGVGRHAHRLAVERTVSRMACSHRFQVEIMVVKCCEPLWTIMKYH